MHIGYFTERPYQDPESGYFGATGKQIMDLTGGNGIAFSFEAVGLKETAEQAFGVLERGGTATLIGMVPEGVKIEISPQDVLGERKLQGSNMGSNRFRVDMPNYVEMYIKGLLKLDEMITRNITLDGINDAFETLLVGEVARQVIVFE